MSGMTDRAAFRCADERTGVFNTEVTETDEPVGIVCFCAVYGTAGLSGSMDFHGSE